MPPSRQQVGPFSCFRADWIVKSELAVFALSRAPSKICKLHWNTSNYCHVASQRSLHYAPIFRLLLKVAVNGTHQCDFLNFCGASVPTISPSALARLLYVCVWVMRFQVFGGSGKHERPIHEPGHATRGAFSCCREGR